MPEKISRLTASEEDRAILAIAIENQVDLRWRLDVGDTEGELYADSGNIDESQDYGDEILRQIAALLQRLVKKKGIDAATFFKSIGGTAVSIPGVIKDQRKLMQISLWNCKGGFRGPVDFRDALLAIADKMIDDRGQSWDAGERERFSNSVLVANDATVSASFEYSKRHAAYKHQFNDDLNSKDKAKREAANEAARFTAQFAYVKLFQGTNVGVVERSPDGQSIPKMTHPEAGHGFPLPHRLDAEANYPGICPWHGWCIEGMIAMHGFQERADRYEQAPEGSRSRDVLHSWKRKLDMLRRKHGGQALDDAFLNYVLKEKSGAAGESVGVDLIAHYAAQLVHSLAIGPLGPKQIVMGGRMATPEILRAVREKVVAWSNGYPGWKGLTTAGIGHFIVGSMASNSERDDTEVLGALVIAEANARAKWKAGKVVVLPRMGS